MNRKIKAFSKKSSSLFVVGSPLQVLCAANAIYEFEIVDYDVVAIYIEGEKRNDQLIQTLKLLNLEYTLLSHNDISCGRYLKNGSCFAFNNLKKYERIFVGNCAQVDYIAFSLSRISMNGDIVFLDDGILTIKYLTETLPTDCNWRIFYYLLRFIAKVRGVGIDNFYTMYYTISSKYNIYANKFDKIIKERTLTSVKELYFVGTNTTAYIADRGMTKEVYDDMVSKELSDIRQTFPSMKITYIPHGRDINEVTKDVCKKLSILYLPIDTAIELYFVVNNICPSCVYGFTSSALFTLKMMFPECIFVNIEVVNKCYPSSKVDKDNFVKRLYEEVGITTKEYNL